MKKLAAYTGVFPAAARTSPKARSWAEHFGHELQRRQRFLGWEQYQLCTVTANASSGGYDAALTIGVAL